ncbi:MAG: hypothetical protein IJ565_03235 [Bacilli bacterium]|nr:hypothetical protein [Bacilli bacterium]
MKKMIPTIILLFVLCFMLLIYEPIIMYATNINDFWFDIYTMIKPITLIFIITFLVLIAISIIIYYVSVKLLKKDIIYDIYQIILFVGFIYLYIQGNFLASSLPSLDGTSINWNSYTTQNVISIVIMMVIIVSTIYSCIKFKIEKVINISKYISLAIFAMLFVSLVTTTLTHDTFMKKTTYSATTKNYNVASKDKNFFIFLLDAIDSVTFEEVINSNSNYSTVFDDFTYYKDTMSTYPFTRDSIPFILSGVWNKNKTSFNEYSTNALDNSILLNKLMEDKYDVNIYDTDLTWNSDNVLKISNMIKLETVDNIVFFKQEAKYVLFKYLPFYLKKYSEIETLDFNEAKEKRKSGYFNWYDGTNYKNMVNNSLELTDNKYFHFLHIEGGHVPFNLNENAEVINDGTYEQKLAGCIKIIDTYLKRIKDAGIYDNSVIIILADHGFNYNEVMGRQNPILFIKGINESHSMITSKIPVSFTDLNDAYIDLLDGKTSIDLFKDIDYNRKRRFMFYAFSKEDNMVEYEQTGKAWDESTMIKTGREFKR